MHPSPPPPWRRLLWPAVLAPLVVLALVAALGRGSDPASATEATASTVVVAVGDLEVEVSVPSGPGPHPVVAHVPGGGWVGIDGSPVHWAFGFDDAAREGWAVLTVPYRTGRHVTAAEQAADVAAVLGWVRSPAAQDLGLGGPVVASGHSAGAHLLALATTRGSRDVRPDALVLVAGVFDLAEDVRASPMLADGLRRAFGCTETGCPGTAHVEPGTWLDAGDPPVALVHGSGDRVTPAAGSARFADALRAAGVPATLELVPGGGHRDAAVDAAVRRALASALAQAVRASSSR